MLPILRILPVGGVLLAILLLALALSPLDGPRAHLQPNLAPARGAMLAQGQHPEWRQFLILAAIHRADELDRLRELQDTPTITEAPPPAAAVAGLLAERGASDPETDGETGSGVQRPAATIPMDIGEASSFELPVITPEETPPPVIKTPQRQRSHRRVHVHHAKVQPKAEPFTPFNFFALLFGNKKIDQPQTADTQLIRQRPPARTAAAARAQ
jgi:hypothetical protein